MKKRIMSSLLAIVLLTGYSINLFADDPLKEGIAFFEKGDYQSAVVSFREAVKEDKKNPQAYIWLGRTYQHFADSLNNAETAFIQARELDSKNWMIFDYLGDVYVAQKVAAAALEQYRKAIEIDKKNAKIFMKIAEVSRKARQYKEAAEAYISVLLIDSTNLSAKKELANIYFRAKQYTNALPLLIDLVKLQPGEISYQKDLVKCLYETKYFTDLIPLAEKIRLTDSTNVDLNNMLRDAYIETKKYDKAYQFIVAQNPDSMSIDELVKAGKSLAALKMGDDAIKMYERAYQKDSTLSEIFYDMAKLYNEKERYADAILMFDKKIAADSSVGYRWACYFQGAQSLAKLKEFKRAKEYISKSIEYKPEYIEAWPLLAQYNEAIGNAAEQESAYKKVIELINKADTASNGNSARLKTLLDNTYRMYAFLLFNQKRTTEAIEYYKKAFAINPKDCKLALTIGQIYHRDKKELDAQQYYCKVIQLCPKSEDAKNAQNYLKMMGLDCK
ncbi:MAG: tetratricopeptide repeat protein [Ignavibacteriales bacterium]|nr:tetratricopeptide repeat protein [Ignavibacteriales bacterium]